MKILCVIPARAGSKTIPKKNIVDLGEGRPLIDYTVHVAKNATTDMDIVITTDMEEVFDYAKAYYIKTISRPAELCTDTAVMTDVIAHAIHTYEEQIGKTIDAVCVLQPTQPFRTVENLNACLTTYITSTVDTVFTAHPCTHPLKMYRADGRAYYQQGHNTILYRKQDHKAFLRNGSIFITSRSTICNHGQMIGRSYLIVPTTKIEGIDIDDNYDLEIAKAILKSH